MAHGFLNPTDLRTERNFLGNIASAIGNRIGKSSNMARKERAFASKKAEDGGTSLEEAGIGKGYFFKRALGSSFGGDRIARTRGRFESDPGPGRDPTGSQASRFRGGFGYDVTNEIFGSAGAAALSGGGLGAGGGAAQKLLEAGPQAINPEVLGGEVASYQGTNTNAAGFTVDTTATEIKDIVGILNQIGQIIVRSNNTTVQAIDSVQRINVKVVDSVQNLGQLQVGIAERQLQQQMLIASNAENTQEQIAARQLAASEKANMAQQRSSSGDLDPEGSGFEGPKGGILGNMLGGMGNLLDTGLSMLGGGRRGRRRGLGRMSRAGRRAQRASGLSTANAGGPGISGMNFRNNSMTGSKLSTNRILAGTAGPGDALGTAQNDITKRYAQRYGQRSAIKRFGFEGLEAAGMSLTKGARVAKFLSPVLKRVPIVGGLLDFGISLALGESVGRAAAKAVGAALGAGLGTFIPIPGVGTILGGIAGDLVGGQIYDALAGGNSSSNSNSESLTPFAFGGIVTKPVAGLVGEAGQEGVFPLEGAKGRKTFLMFGEGILDAQKNNKKKYAELQAIGLGEYFDKKPWWKGFLDALGEVFPDWLTGGRDDNDDGGGDDDDDRRRNNNGGGGNMDAADIKADTAEEKAFIATVRELEGTSGEKGYNTWFGGRNEMDMTSMTIQEVHDEQTRRMNAGETTYQTSKGPISSAAVGAGQFMEPLEQVRAMYKSQGKDFDPTKVKFTEELQNQLMLDLAKRKRGVDVSKPLTLGGMKKLGGEWASFTPQHGQTSRTAVESLRVYDENLGEAKKKRVKDIRNLIEALGGDPDAKITIPEITAGPQANTNLLEKTSAVLSASSELNSRPVVAVLSTDASQKETDQSSVAMALASPGSGSMGTHVFVPASFAVL